MKKLFKYILPPFIGFTGYFLAVRYSGVYFQLQIDEMGEGTVQSFMAYYRYFLPLLFVVAVLTQGLIVVPIWNKVLAYQKWYSKLVDFVSVAFICLLFAGGISYLISDPQHHIHRFIKLSLFMTAVQMGYWLINVLILYLLDLKRKSHPTTKKTETERDEQI